MWLDIIFGLMLIYGAISGWRNGLLKELCSTFGFLIGLFLAYKYYEQIGYGVFGFLLIWIGAPVVLGILASLVSFIFNKVLLVGFMNRLAGAALGVAKFFILIGIIYMLGQKLGIVV